MVSPDLNGTNRIVHQTHDFRHVFFESSRDVLLLIHEDKYIEYSPAALAFFGCSASELVGKSLPVFCPDLQPDGKKSKQQYLMLQERAHREPVINQTWQFVRQDGTTIAAEISLRQVENDGQEYLLQSIYPANNLAVDAPIDLSDKIRQIQMQKLDSLGLMAGGLAHDFNNLLLAILGNADLLDHDLENSSDSKQLLDEIRKAAGRAADLCTSLMAFAGKGQIVPQKTDLSNTVRGMIQMIKVAVSRKITVRLELGANLPLVDADVAQIHQVIMNLVVNSSEAIGSESGTITISTGITDCAARGWERCVLNKKIRQGKNVYLDVKDDGVGMANGIVHQIFDPFYSTKVKGRGLGLSSVLGIMRAHHGAICVNSEVGEGSAVRICLPIEQVDNLSVAHIIDKSSIAADVGKVLVVDDEEYLRVLCARMLRRLGYEVIMASGGAQALEMYGRDAQDIGCVMLDLSMPELDGAEVHERLVAMDPDVRVIMTSGYHEREIAVRFAGRGISGFLQKPYIMSDLDAAMSQVLQLKKP